MNAQIVNMCFNILKKKKTYTWSLTSAFHAHISIYVCSHCKSYLHLM